MALDRSDEESAKSDGPAEFDESAESTKPDEPEEYDPEAKFRDPDSDSITIPRLESENAGSGLGADLRSDIGSEAEADLPSPPEVSAGETDVPSDLLKEFWALVLVLNGVVLAYALAAMFFVFEGETTYATYLFAAGLVLTGFAIRRYRTVKRTEFSTDETDDADAESADDDTTHDVEGGDSAIDDASDHDAGGESTHNAAGETDSQPAGRRTD